MLTDPARQYFFATPPRVGQLAVPGSMVRIAVTTGAAVINLSTLWPQDSVTGAPGNNTAYGMQLAGVCDQRIIVTAVTANLGIVTGKAIGDVTGANAPSLSAAGTVDGNGNYTNALGTCATLLSGQAAPFRPTSFQDLFLGFVGSTSGFIEIYQISHSDS